MSFLLDTNVVSESMRPRPSGDVSAWLAAVDEDQVFLSVVTMAELRRGMIRLAHGRRRERLQQWLDHELPVRFEGRLLNVDADVAMVWGEITATREQRGRPIPPMDAFIAATARVHGLTLVTRNVADFDLSLPDLVNPWSA